MRFDRFIDIAKAIYDPDAHPTRTFHCSFIVNKNKILSIGINKTKTHTANLFNPKIGREGSLIYDKGVCSELDAIKKFVSKCDTKTEYCSMVNVRVSRIGNIGYSMPCSSCKSLLGHYRFKNVFYTDINGKFKRWT